MFSDDHKKAALSHLNEICPDTFDEGEFGPWTFGDITREGDTWTLAFSNSEGVDSVSFTFAGDCVTESGSVVDDWFEQINSAIIEWEMGMSDF